MANAIASLLVSIGADVSGLESGGRKGGKAMDSLGAKAGELSAKMAAVGAAAVAAGVAITAGLVKSGLDAIDAQAKLARALGGSIDGLRGLQLAAKDAGIDSNELTSSLRTLNQRIGEAQRGTGTAAQAFKVLGLSAQEVSKLDTDQRMAAIADRVKELGLSATQTGDLLKQLGIRGNENLITMMRQGGDAIRSARGEVDAFGLSISQVDAAKIEMANDAMSRIGLVIESIRNQLTIAFAPILKELADRFNNLSKENKGFSEQARNAAEIAIRSFAKVADVIHGVRVVLKGVQLVATGFGAAFVSAGELVIKVFAGISDLITKTINLAIRGLNMLGASIEEMPTFQDSAFMRGLSHFGDAARDQVGKVRTELHDLAMQELPSTKVEKFLEDVRARAQEAAELMASNDLGGGTFESEDEAAKKEEERRQKELDRHRDALQSRLQAVAEFMASERDLEVFRHEERMALLQEGLEAEMISLEEFHIAKETLEEGHAKRMADIRKKGMTDLEKFTNASMSKQVGIVSGHLADMTAGVARENKAMFEINKAAGIANAIVAAYEGISKTLGAYPYPVNIALAAAHAAAAFAQVSAIKSQSFSSGGSAAPSLAGGTPATPVTPVTGGTPASAGGGSLLTVEGVSADSLFSGRAVRELMDKVAEHIRDGGTVQFA